MDDRNVRALIIAAKQDNHLDHERGAQTIDELHLMGILGPGSVCSPRALLMRRIIINGCLLDSLVPLHIEVIKLGIGKDSKIVFKSEALVFLLHVLWGMYRVQIRNVLRYIRCPTTTIEACHIPAYGGIRFGENTDSMGGKVVYRVRLGCGGVKW